MTTRTSRKRSKADNGENHEIVGQYLSRLLVIASLRQGNYGDLVLPHFDKRVELTSAGHGKLNADIYDKTKTGIVAIAERELALVRAQPAK